MPNRRTVLTGMSALGLSGCTTVGIAESYNATVTRAVKGARQFGSIKAALTAAPNDGRPYRILVSAGVWRERVIVDKPNVEIVGMGKDLTTIVFNMSAADKGPDGQPLGTFGTATMVVRAPGFSIKHVTIDNDFDYVGHLPKPVPDDRTGASGSQAVALAIQDDADRSYFEDVVITGYQDTLYANAGRSLFRACRIEGCVDFIFGAGRAVFDTCEIVSRLRPGQDFNGFVAAPNTNLHQPYGFLFLNCRLSKEKGVAAATVALGRPWRRTGSFPDGRYGDPEAVGVAVYANCWMDDHIVPEGWYPMGYNLKGGGRGLLQPEEVRFYEFGSSGPGAGQASVKRRILTPEQALPFTALQVLDGWSP